MALLTNAFDTSIWSFALPIAATDGSAVDFSLGVTTAAFRDTRANGAVIATASTEDGSLSFVPASGDVPAYFAVDLPASARGGFTVPRPTAVAFDLQWAADPAHPTLRTMLGRESIMVHPSTDSTGPTGEAQSPVLVPAQPYDGRVVSGVIQIGPQGPVDTAYTDAQVAALKGGVDSTLDTLKKLGDLIAALGITSIAGLQAALASKATPADVAASTAAAATDATTKANAAQSAAISAAAADASTKASSAQAAAISAAATDASTKASSAQAAAIAAAATDATTKANAAQAASAQKASNLSDLTDKAAARGNLNTFSKAETSAAISAAATAALASVAPSFDFKTDFTDARNSVFQPALLGV